MNRELRVAALYDEPVDRTGVHNSADFTSVFAHRRHHSLSLVPLSPLPLRGSQTPALDRLSGTDRQFYYCQPPPSALYSWTRLRYSSPRAVASVSSAP